MTNRVFQRISRFFDGVGRVLSTPSGDARGHLRVPIDTMFDHDSGTRVHGR
jgi:hypothetical protein